MTNYAADAGRMLERMRAAAPLVHNITNYVAMDVTANALLALGASPAMVHAADEVEDFVAISQALVVNIGTLSPPWVEAMLAAARRAKDLGRPWVLDPVGAGATPYRTRVAGELARLGPTVIRGNASEILAVAGESAATKGVDSVHGSDAALAGAESLARELGTVVAVTGAVDYISDGATTRSVRNGHPMMTKITALGCTASAMVAAFLAIEGDAVAAAAGALAVLGLAGEQAASGAQGPGTLRVRLIDALYQMDAGTLARGAQIG